ncbi:hypothetical protein FA15DRAFT_709719 [Coprinopsis marcescibilis]|uniref:Uncharacterized protein n=1 Tax=Coprinopsis marcescibilis TaxID=230819 RepID=A0A5C3KFK3_COPMA|nr:hypothetical protein FA15DRAFT_709719 [Coprinopsis marcescibilis]
MPSLPLPDTANGNGYAGDTWQGNTNGDVASWESLDPSYLQAYGEAGVQNLAEKWQGIPDVDAQTQAFAHPDAYEGNDTGFTRGLTSVQGNINVTVLPTQPHAASANPRAKGITTADGSQRTAEVVVPTWPEAPTDPAQPAKFDISTVYAMAYADIYGAASQNRANPKAKANTKGAKRRSRSR